MNLDPTGSPRHEQTVAVALRFIIAQDSVQRPGDEKQRKQSMVTAEVIESMGAPGGVEPPTTLSRVRPSWTSDFVAGMVPTAVPLTTESPLPRPLDEGFRP
jgi:hypothetical protein